MKKNIEEIINETAINKLKRSTPKKDNDKQCNELKRNILNMSIDLLKEKKINKTAYNKMIDLSIGKARVNALEDAYNALLKIKDSEVKVHAKDFKKLKSEEKEKRSPDKFIMMIKNKAKKLHRYHLTVKINRKITYTNKKTGKINKYKEEDHNKKIVGHDNLIDSRVVEASSLDEAKRIYSDLIMSEQTFEEYSSNALVDVENIEFLGGKPVEESQITSSDPRNMPLRQSGYIEYNFTQQETKYLMHENTCVIDNLVGLYGKELHIDKDDIIKLNKDFHGYVDEDNEPEYIESDLGDLMLNPKYSTTKKIKDLEAKLKHNEEEYIKTLHPYHIEMINDFQTEVENYESIDIFCKEYNITIDDYNNYKNNATPIYEEHVYYKTFYGMEIKFSDDATPEYKKMIYEKHGVEPKQEKYISVKQINKVKQYAKIKDLKTGVKSIKDYDMINEDSSLYNNVYYEDEIKRIQEQIKEYERTDDVPTLKPKYNINNAFTPAFIEYFCKKYGISHYAFDIDKTCF